MPIMTFQAIRGTDVNAVVARLASQSVEAGQAKSLLNGIKSELGAEGARAGVLRIRSGKNQADASLSVVGRQRWGFLGAAHSDQRLATGRALAALLSKAGTTQAVIDQFEAYRASQGRKGIDAAVMLRFIDRALSPVESAESLDQLHAKLDLSTMAELGRGAGGKVYQAQHKGEAMVLKTFDSPSALSTSRAGTLSRAQEGAAATFLKHVPGLLGPTLYMVKTERRSDDESITYPRGFSPFGGRQRAYSMDSDGSEVEGCFAAPGAELKAQSAGEVRYHAVPADKRFRDWSRQNLRAGTTAEIVESLMPQACGPNVHTVATQSDKGAIPEKIWHKALGQGLKTLGELAQHGFVHGDIKCKNLCMNPKTGQLQLIDVDGMLKRSKLNPDAPAAATLAQTPSFSVPVRAPDDGAGADQDVFGLGMSILYGSLVSRGKTEIAEQLLDTVELSHRDVHVLRTPTYTTAEARLTLKAELSDLLNQRDSAGRRELKLNAAETQAFALMEKALEQPRPVLQRYVPGQVQHPFAELYRLEQ